MYLTATERLIAVTKAAGLRLAEMPAWLFSLIVMFIAGLKIGASWYGAEQVIASAQALPLPYDYSSTGVLGPAIIRLLNLGTAGWAILTPFLILVAALLPVWLVRLRSANSQLWRIALIVFVCWPASFTSFQFLGHYQDVLPLAMVAAMLTRNKWLVFVGLCCAVSSNPEQAFFGFLALIILSLGPTFRAWMPRAIGGTALAVLAIIATRFWLVSNEVPGRFDMLMTDLQYSVSANTGASVLGIYAWWGPWWLLIIFVAVSSKKRDLLPLLVSVLLLPGFLTFITVDGTRVFASIAAPVGLAVAWNYLGMQPKGESLEKVDLQPIGIKSCSDTLVLWFAALVLLPLMVSFVGANSFHSNWQFIVTQITDRLQ